MSTDCVFRIIWTVAILTPIWAPVFVVGWDQVYRWINRKAM